VPVVTDIPSFRAIVGDGFARWQPGDAGDFARALLQTCAADLEALKAAARARFEHALSWDALGAKTVAEYRTLISR
jgi:glycosyltransferase involved in cell wall biosynthesis